MNRVGWCFCVLAFFALSHSMHGQDLAMKMTLDGEWLFKVDTAKAGVDSAWFADSLDRSGWQKVKVPEFWESYPGMATYDGWGWFFRSVRIEKLDQPLSLHFAGVDDDASDDE